MAVAALRGAPDFAIGVSCRPLRLSISWLIMPALADLTDRPYTEPSMALRSVGYLSRSIRWQAPTCYIALAIKVKASGTLRNV
jgi:hypothetical protein